MTAGTSAGRHEQTKSPGKPKLLKAIGYAITLRDNSERNSTLSFLKAISAHIRRLPIRSEKRRREFFTLCAFL